MLFSLRPISSFLSLLLCSLLCVQGANGQNQISVQLNETLFTFTDSIDVTAAIRSLGVLDMDADLELAKALLDLPNEQRDALQTTHSLGKNRAQWILMDFHNSTVKPQEFIVFFGYEQDVIVYGKDQHMAIGNHGTQER